MCSFFLADKKWPVVFGIGFEIIVRVQARAGQHVSLAWKPKAFKFVVRTTVHKEKLDWTVAMNPTGTASRKYLNLK